MIAEPYAPLSDTNDDKVCAMNLVETCVNAHWSFGGAYYDARDECYKASFRRFVRDNRPVAPGAKPRRRSMTEIASGAGETLCRAIVMAAQNALEEE